MMNRNDDLGNAVDAERKLLLRINVFKIVTMAITSNILDQNERRV